MGWDEHEKRRSAIRSVLGYAAANPAAGLPYEQLPEVAARFANRRELVLALQFDWMQAVWSRIELLSLEGRNGRLLDAQQLAERAYADCAAQHPVLRRLLDTYRDEIGPSARSQEELLRFA